jgi:hypothetical protein
VFAQRLDWTENVRPMALDAIIEVIRANREKLIASGRAKSAGDTPGGMPIVDMSELARRAAVQLEGRARLAIAGTEFKTSDEAIASNKPNPVRRGMARAKWIADNLGKMVPGRLISVPRGGDGVPANLRQYMGQRSSVILDIVPPADKRESQLAQWRVLTIAPGEQRPVSTTLNALIGRITLDTEERESEAGPGGQRGGPREANLTIKAHSLTKLGADLIELHEADAEQRRGMRGGAWVYNDFSERFVGERKRKALVLTGNMYLASEWASETKAGRGVIFTDERGMRQRGIVLRDQFKPEWIRYLPARLWMPGMINRFADRLLDGSLPPANGQYKLYGSFEGAWKSTENQSTDRDAIIVVPGTGLLMHVGRNSRRRINAMLRQAQKTIKEELMPGVKVRPQDDPGHVVIKEAGKRAERLSARGEAVAQSSRKEADYIVLQAQTPERMRRAFEMLMRGPGLEIFVPSHTELGAVAKACMNDYYVERLREDAQGDPGRLAKLEELLARDEGERLTSEAEDLDRELRSILAVAGGGDRDRPRRAGHPVDDDFGQSELDLSIDAGDEVSSAAPGGAAADRPVDVNAMFGSARPARETELADDAEEDRGRGDRMVA